MQLVLRTVVILLILAGTAFLLVSNNPEERSVTSGDGRVTVTATLARDQTLDVAEVPGTNSVVYTAVLGPVYQLYPAGQVLTTPATLTFSYGEAIPNAQALALRVGYFDDAFQMWRTVETRLDTSKHQASASINEFSEWALLQLDDVARPNFEKEITALISAPPEGAVGYTLEVGYSDQPGDFVILNGAGKSGGCGGQYQTGESTQMTSTSDMFGDNLEYQIVAVWEIGEGCGDKLVIE